jgi:hypothetical protein
MKAAFESLQFILLGKFAEDKFFDDGQGAPHLARASGPRARQ